MEFWKTYIVMNTNLQIHGRKTATAQIIHPPLLNMSTVHYPSAAPTSLPRVAYTGSSVFEDPIVSTTSRAGLSQTAIIILVSTIPIVSCLAIVFGILHVVRRRNERILQARRQADVERNLMIAAATNRD
jgi:beta-lactamase regulating signal transducer with metallopeptidase domain